MAYSFSSDFSTSFSSINVGHAFSNAFSRAYDAPVTSATSVVALVNLLRSGFTIYDPTISIITPPNVPTLSASYHIYSPTVYTIVINTQYPNGNFTGDCVVKNNYFNYRGNCYTNEKKLYDKLLSSYINSNGVKLVFYVVDYNVEYDTIFGEDLDRTFMRKFPIMGMFELPQQERNVTLFGIDEIDTFHIHVAKKHFENASKLNYDGSKVTGYIYDSYTPKAGDILKANYNNTFYQVLDCRGERDTQFLQEKHAWDMTVRVLKNEHHSLDTSTSATMPEINTYLQETRSPFGDW